MPDPSLNALLSWWRLIRGGNVLISGVATLVGAYLVREELDWLTAFWIPWAPMLITAAGNIQNDLRDSVTDRLSHPDRPLVTGAVAPPSAVRAMIGCYIGGLVAASATSPVALAIAGLVVLGLTLYNYRLSRTVLLGNFAVAVMAALPVLYGGLCLSDLASQRLTVALAAGAIAFWLHLSREFLKDVLDREGDVLSGRQTLAIILGDRFTIRLAGGCMVMGAVFALWPALVGMFSVLYTAGIAVTVVPALLFGAAQCWWRPVPPIASVWAWWLKITMLTGLIFMVIGTPAG